MYKGSSSFCIVLSSSSTLHHPSLSSPFCLPSSSQSVIYYLVHSPKLSTWLKDASIQEALLSYTKWHHIERDPQVFSVKIDEDYVHCLQGVTRASFCNVYLEWIQHCASKMETVHHLKGQSVGFRRLYWHADVFICV